MLSRNKPLLQNEEEIAGAGDPPPGDPPPQAEILPRSRDDDPSPAQLEDPGIVPSPVVEGTDTPQERFYSVEGSPPAADEWGTGDYALDMLKGVGDGLVGFAASVYGFVRSTVEMDEWRKARFLDRALTSEIVADRNDGPIEPLWLPHWKPDRMTESVAGGLTSGVVEFLAAFIPIAGWLGKGGKLTRGGEMLTPGLSVARERAYRELGESVVLSRSKSGWGVVPDPLKPGMRVRTSLFTGDMLKAAGRSGDKVAFNRMFYASMGADFIAFPAHEARFSDLLFEWGIKPAEWLASEEDDSELLGRLKNVVEGLGFSAAISAGIMVAAKGIRAGKKVERAGGTAEEIEEAFSNATNAHQDVVDALESMSPQEVKDLVPANVAFVRRRGEPFTIEGTGKAGHRLGVYVGKVEDQVVEMVRYKTKWYNLEDLKAGKEAGISIDKIEALGDSREAATNVLRARLQVQNDPCMAELDAAGRRGDLPDEPLVSTARGRAPESLRAKVGSWFSGGGIMEGGLRGIHSAHAAEIEPGVNKTFNRAHGTKHEPVDVINDPNLIAKLKAANVDHFHCSPECKTSSLANRGKGLGDEGPRLRAEATAADLLAADRIAKAIDEVRPPTFSFENVPQYKDVVDANGRSAWDRITKALDDAGYKWEEIEVDAADFGGAQTRKRLIIRAVREGDLPPLPAKTGPSDWYLTLKDLIDSEVKSGNLEKPPGKSELGNLQTATDRFVESGGKEGIDGSKPIIIMGGSVNKKVANARHAGTDEMPIPSPTLPASRKQVVRIILPDVDDAGNLKPLAERTTVRASPRMMARLMGLPDEFKIPDTYGAAKNVLGNGIHAAVSKNFIDPLLPSQQVLTDRAAREAGTPLVDATVGEVETLNKLIKVLTDLKPERAHGDPRKMKPTQLKNWLRSKLGEVIGEMDPKHLNTNWDATPVAVTIRAIEAAFPEKLSYLGIKDDASLREVARDMVSDYLGMNPKDYDDLVTRHVKEADQQVPRMLAHLIVLESQGKQLHAVLKKLLTTEDGGKRWAQEISDAEFAQAMQVARNALSATNAVGSMSSAFGRGLRMKRAYNMQKREIAEWMDTYEGATGVAKEKMREDLQKILDMAQEGDHAGIARMMKMLKTSPPKRFGRIFRDTWINMLLYAVPTMTINLFSGWLHAVTRPMGQSFGEALRGNIDGAKDELKMLVDLLPFTEVWGEASKLGWQSLRQGGEPILTRTTKLNEGIGSGQQFDRAISAEYVGVDPDSLLGLGVNWLGKAVYMPTRVLGSGDEFIKQLVFRAEAKKRLGRMAIDQGIENPEDIARFIVDGMDKILVDGQKVSVNAVLDKGFREAELKFGDSISARDREREAYAYFDEHWDESESLLEKIAIANRSAEIAETITFTTDLKYGRTGIHAIGRGVQSAVNEYGILTAFAPFIKTPTNILAWSTERSVGNAAAIFSMAVKKVPVVGKHIQGAKTNWERDFAAGGETRAGALGRMATAVGLTTSVSLMVANDGITGSGPQDPHLRKIWTDKLGYRPYSFVFGDMPGGTVISYARFDPWATFLGTTVDIMNHGKFTPPEDRGLLEGAGAAVILSFTEQLKHKTFLRGIDQGLTLFSGDEKAIVKTLGRYAGSFVPRAPMQAVSGISGLIAGEGLTLTDPLHREVHGIVDALRVRSAWTSRGMNPVRDVLGEVQRRVRVAGDSDSAMANFLDATLPFAFSQLKEDRIAHEFVELRHPFMPPPAVRGDGVDYRDFKNPQGQHAHNKMMELRGKISLEDGNLRRALNLLFDSEGYKLMSPLVGPDGGQSPRIGKIKAVLQRYHRAAVFQVHSGIAGEFKNAEGVTLKRALEAAKERAQDLQRGGGWLVPSKR